jgi:endonuclease YncB( thermonuclease family)
MNDPRLTPTEASSPLSTPQTGARAAGASGPALGIAVGLALLVGGIGGYVLGTHRAAVGADGRSAAEQGARDAAERSRSLRSREQQVATRRLSEWRMKELDPLAEPRGPTTLFEPVLRLTPPFDAVDATLIDSLDTRVRLAQARPVGRNEICVNDAGLRSACGLKGRASLQNHLYGKAVTCVRLFLGPDPRGGKEERGRIVDARCSIAGEDLALHQIRAGFAFPSEFADADHLAALAEARRVRAGVWAGPYEIRADDQSEVDAREVPFGSLRLAGPEAPGVAGAPAAAPPDGATGGATGGEE